jgi:conserved oligomeric Golgi complex subunit 4
MTAAPPRRRAHPHHHAQDRHAELLERLASVRERQRDQQRDCAHFLRDAAAPEKAAAVRAVRDLRALTPEVTVLCAQTGAVVERIANANDVAAKMTKEVRRLDILQSRLTTTLAQSSQLLSLRNALAGIRRAMQLRNYPEAATFLKQLKAIEQVMALDVADKLRVDTIESDLKGVIETAFDDGLRAADRAQVQLYAPLFQVVSVAYEERGFQQLLDHVTAALEQQLAPLVTGSFSTKELMDHLTSIFNGVAAVAQEYDQLAGACFAHVSGVNRLITAIYALGERAAAATLAAYMQQRKFHDRMSERNTRKDAAATASSSGAPAAPGVAQAEDAIAKLNDQLNEVALLIQHTQTYERFMRSRVAGEQGDADAVLPASSESELGKTVQELAGYYCFFENELLTLAAKKAFQWEELRYSSAITAAGGAGGASGASPATGGGDVVTFPISSAIDEIFYVARNSAMRGLATGHADCAAGVLNLINTMLRDALGDTMRSRIRTMAAHVPRVEDHESGLLAASNQLRDQMQQLAKLSKLQLPAGAAAPPPDAPKERGPDVVMNSLEATGDYIAQLKAEIERELREDFDAVPSHLQSCLGALDDAAAELAQLLVAARKKLCQVLEPKLHASLAPLLAPTAKKAVTYELTDQMYTFNEANDPFAHAFVVALRDVLAAFRPRLSPPNYASLVDALAGATAEALERWLQSRGARFTALGALQWDKDLRVVSALFSSESGRDAARARFAVLTQMAAVLSVDAPADVADVFGRRSRGGVAWKLSAAQTKELLARRVEFSAAAISQLVL